MTMTAISTMNDISKFLEEIQKVSTETEDFKVLTFISNIDWGFINTANETEIDKTISYFTDFLTNFSQHKNVVQKLCEVIMKYLYISPNPNKQIKNYDPILILIWSFYFSNPCFKSDIQYVIKHIFPHFLGATYESTIGYIDNLLKLISNKTFNLSSILFKYKESNELFVKDMQYFVLDEIINYFTDFDVRLVLKNLQYSETERPIELQNQIKKLDKIIDLIFTFINNHCYDHSQLNWARTEDLFKKIKRIYTQRILSLSMCNSLYHVHYILAYMTSLHPSLSKHMCEYFWTLASDEDQNISLRCAAVKHLSGFVSKFNFINIGLVINILTEMFSFANTYLDQIKVSEQITEKHNIIYCTVNGGLYVLLHRHKEIIDYFGSVSDFAAYADAWSLSYITMHRFNILKEFPNRDHLPKLCKLFRNCYLGFIDTIVEEQVLRKSKPTLMVGIPFRYYFLPDSMELLSKYRVSGEKHCCLD